MTPDDIIKLAREVGAPVGVMALGRHDGVLFTPYELEHFVALVAAAEREACATIDVTPLNILASDGPGTAILKYRAAIRARGQS